MTTISFDLLARDRASAVFNKVGRAADRNATALEKLSRFGRSSAAVAGGSVLAAGLVKTISLAKDFDLTMRQVGVQTGQSGAQMKSLSALAMKMGADTAFSAQDAGDAMLGLAKGGLTAAQIKAGALKTTMTLAAAGGIDLASSADYVTQGMNTFGLSARQASQVAVALAGGANASTASVDSLGQALSQVGPGAKTAGLSIQETVAALSAFDNAGIKGSDAGTSLKTMLQRLVPSTNQAKTAMAQTGLSFTNANGSFKSLGQIAQQLKTHLGNLSQVQRQQALTAIFGSDASRAATVLMDQGAKGVQHYVAATKNQATVQKMANTAMSGASGAWEQFTGSLETAGIKIGTALLPAFTTAANDGAKFVNEVTTWGPQLQDAFGPSIHLAGQLVGAMKPLGEVALDIGHGIGSLPRPVKSTAVEAAILALVLPRVTAGITSTGTAAMSAGARVIGFGQDLTTSGAAGEAAMRKVTGAAKQAAGIGGVLALSQAAQQTSRSMGALEGAAGGALLGFSMGGPIGAGIGALAGGLLGLVKSTHNASSAFKLSSGDAQSYAASLNQITGAATAATRAVVLNKLSSTGALKAGLSAGVSSRTLIDAALGKPAAIQAAEEGVARLKDRVKELNREIAAPHPDRTAIQGAADRDRYSKELAANADAQKKLQGVMGPLAAGYANQAAQARLAYYANTKLSTVLKGFPKSAVTEIKANGVEHTKASVLDLARTYNLTPKQIVAVAGLAHYDITLGQAKTLKAGLDNYTGTYIATAGLNDQASGKLSFVGRLLSSYDGRTATATITTIQRTVYESQGNAKRGQLTARASGGPVTAGTPYLVGERGRELYVPDQSGYIINNNALRAAAFAQSRPNRTASAFAPLTASTSAYTRAGQQASEAYWTAYDKAHEKHLKKSVQKARDAALKIASTQRDAVKKILADRSEFIGGFRSSFGGSIFGQSSDDGQPTTLAGLIAAQQSKAIAAQQTRTDVSAAISKGLSRTLLAQLQATGDTGALHAIAGGSADQIATLNSLSSQTATALQQASEAAGNAEYVKQLAASIKGHTTVVHVDLSGKTMVKSIRTFQSEQGLKVTV